MFETIDFLFCSSEHARKKITDQDAEEKLQKEKDSGNEHYYNTGHGMWLDVITKSSSDEKIQRHREVLTTRNNKSKNQE